MARPLADTRYYTFWTLADTVEFCHMWLIGEPTSVIAERFGISKNNVRARAKLLRKKGVNLPKRGDKKRSGNARARVESSRDADGRGFDIYSLPADMADDEQERQRATRDHAAPPQEG